MVSAIKSRGVSSAIEEVSLTLPAGVTLVGSETSIIWTPSSTVDDAATYVLGPKLNEVMPRGESNIRELVSVIESVADISSGSETSIIWTPLSYTAVTAT